MESRSYDFRRRNDVNGEKHRLVMASHVKYKGETWRIASRFFTAEAGKGLVPAYSLARVDGAGNTLSYNRVLQSELVIRLEEEVEDCPDYEQGTK